jgi:hypothetical protein
MKKFVTIATLAAGLGVASSGNANLVTNPNFVGAGGVGGYGEFYPDPSSPTNYNPGYAVQIAGWNAPQDYGYNQGAPFLFAVNPTTIDTTGFPDSWDNNPSITMWGSANGGTEVGSGIAAGPPNGASTALLLDADYHITPIYQVIDPSQLTVGQEYTVSFDYAFAQWFGRYGPTTEGLEIGLGGAVLQLESLNPATGVNGFNNPSQTFNGWYTFTGSFYYNGNPTNMTFGVDYGGETFSAAANWLTFIGEGSPQGLPPSILITGVSLTEAVPGTPPYVNPGVPEPAAWVMVLMGVGGLGGLARRRRAASSLAS